ncbi:baculoviral IAP repeat-containing protein 7-B-like [Neocloeon triangulifer]|uniref:baculoviral IAP repeat-containing protein 7-B-like n=1 Tax=Neocloeon triangulifer TaxID=2078957 RepID=UPI00286FAA69|nr:baculoviral IAP repeat-containing protein 7-B-like [Neocloeon triangulifer]XP_059473204.1 baculoviral IAP repeat-containing protein 7-B-like [Neocloeon triangulifer]XP_059473205.1 baculoviral IAP repeat-containing protein 7-B-like [Neocloeon triangulifer]XP_059473206.1 baculoviral IAP repeat-containing protein 7-B-like [Neocloeon triangulifer]
MQQPQKDRPFLPAKMTLCLKFAMHRYFTYPESFRQNFSVEQMASDGLYLAEDGAHLCCYFCNFKILKSECNDWRQQHSAAVILPCPIFTGTSQNVPMDLTRLNYKYETHRLFSLLQNSNWQFVTPYDLAKSGFYYLGLEDRVRCIFCCLEVSDWCEGDTPDGEHSRFDSECRFLKDPLSVANVKIGSEELGHGNNSISDHFEPISKVLARLGPWLRVKKQNLPLSSLSIKEWKEPKYPENNCLAARLATFKLWPKSLSQKPKQMAMAGFFYVGVGDRVCCFHCGLGLSNWVSEENPYEQHVKWEGACCYLQTVSRVDFIENKNLHSEEAAAQVQVGGVGTVKCGTCRTQVVNTAVLPCGHLCLCEQCSVEKCPVCGGEALAQLRVFF